MGEASVCGKSMLLCCVDTKWDTESSTYYPKSHIEGPKAFKGEAHVVAEVFKGEPGAHSASDGINKFHCAKSCVFGPSYS